MPAPGGYDEAARILGMAGGDGPPPRKRRWMVRLLLVLMVGVLAISGALAIIV